MICVRKTAKKSVMMLKFWATLTIKIFRNEILVLFYGDFVIIKKEDFNTSVALAFSFLPSDDDHTFYCIVIC